MLLRHFIIRGDIVMVPMKQLASGITSFAKARIYPGLSASGKTRLSLALGVANYTPEGVFRFLLSVLLPEAVPEQLVKSGVLLGVLDGEGGVNEEMLLELAAAHAKENGSIGFAFGGIEISLTEANIEDMREYIAKAKTK